MDKTVYRDTGLYLYTKRIKLYTVLYSVHCAYYKQSYVYYIYTMSILYYIYTILCTTIIPGIQLP